MIKVPEVLEKSACMNSMKRTADGNGSQWIGHMNSIAAQVASCRKLPVERERTLNKGARGWNKSCDRWPGDVANAYAVITRNRKITVTIIEYHGMSQQKNVTLITSTITEHG
jgi:hypothetical protein